MTAAPAADLRLPTVSVIVTNYNYGAFVGDALRSVAAQTYPHIEIVVVDDHSSDDSWDVIQRLVAGDPRLGAVVTHRLPERLGQTGASAFGLQRSRGSYVILLDADDILMPRCVETHVYALLSARLPVGFSSVRSLTFRDGEIVATGVPSYTAAFVASGAGRLPGMVSPIDVAGDGLWPADLGGAPLKPTDIHFVLPPQCQPWVWSTLSGDCFRRDILALFLTGPVEGLWQGTDGFLVVPISSLCGSIVLDRVLMGYRVHGANAFAAVAPRLQLRHYEAAKQIGKMVANGKAAIRQMIDRADVFAPLCETPDYYFASIASQCRAWPLGSEHGDPDHLAKVLVEHRQTLVRAFGEGVVADWLARAGIGDRAELPDDATAPSPEPPRPEPSRSWRPWGRRGQT